MKKKILSVLLALVLALSFSLVGAVPNSEVAASPDPDYIEVTFDIVDDRGSVEWSTEDAIFGSYSVKITEGSISGPTQVRFAPSLGTTFADLESVIPGGWSWWYKPETAPGPWEGLKLLFVDPGNSDNFVEVEDKILYPPSAEWTKRDFSVDHEWAGKDSGSDGYFAITGSGFQRKYPFNNPKAVYDAVLALEPEAESWVLDRVRAQSCSEAKYCYFDDITINGETYYLEPRVVNIDSTEGFNTIQDAIDDADPAGGDTINVAAGTYKEHIVITTSNLSLIGENRETTIIDATHDPSWVVEKPGILIGEYPLEDGVHGVTVSGFTIRDAAMQEGGGYYGGTASNVGPQAIAGILIYNSDNNVIENNILVNNHWQVFVCAEWAFYYDSCRNNRIANNIIRDSEQDGVYLYSDGGVFLEDTEIVNNEISNVYGEFASGIEFWGWTGGDDTPTISGTIITGNTITNCTYGVRIREGVSDITGTSVNYNNFVDNTNYGLLNDTSATIDATHNWWGTKTGPYHATTNPGVVDKMGNAVSDKVNFSPWLYKTQDTIVKAKEPAYAQSVVLDNAGDYGWNTFSTPIVLDDTADTWAKLITLTGLDYSVAYRFDPARELPFVLLNTDDDHAITPGEGFFVKMRTAGSLPILYSTADNLALPSQTLTIGFNLIGLASLEDMLVENALFSLAGDGQVVSPTGNESPGAVLTGRTVYVGEAYWVYMLGERTLVGFTTTPANWVP